ncbi:Asp23/Gls24 family envelope stress response protein [Gordonia sp. CPCC 205333]|uniref:Asp23/Gls24 family envelope stress response protein n=1 Tax=Gordonia sp. CPCC 205333 TaxID=3140790 RepID=UPI003AF33ABC
MADEQGSLVVRRRVYEKLAERAALSVDDVLAQSTGITAAFDDQASNSAALYRSLPRAVAHDDGSAISLSIAVRWPARVNEVCRTVSDQVVEDLFRFTGERPVRVDVDVAQLVSADTDSAGATSGTRGKPQRRRRSGFIDLPSASESVDLKKAASS